MKKLLGTVYGCKIWAESEHEEAIKEAEVSFVGFFKGKELEREVIRDIEN